MPWDGSRSQRRRVGVAPEAPDALAGADLEQRCGGLPPVALLRAPFVETALDKKGAPEIVDPARRQVAQNERASGLLA